MGRRRSRKKSTPPKDRVRSAPSPTGVFDTVRRATVAFGFETSGTPTIIGSGFASRADHGLVVTAAHVLEELYDQGNETLHPVAIIPLPVAQDGDNITVTYRQVRLHGARTASHNTMDVAVLWLDHAFPRARALDIDLRIAPSGGYPIATCGWPFGAQTSLTQGPPLSSFLTGIVSAVYPHPAVGVELRTRYLAQLPVNPGNSGGPVFDSNTGKVFGLVSGRLETEGNPTGLAEIAPIVAVDHIMRGISREELET